VEKITNSKMKTLYTLTILTLLLSCTNNNSEPETNKTILIENEIVKSEFQSILDSANVKGSILFYDLQEDKYYSNDFEWSKKGQLPASTFKIPNSIIALETGIIEHDSTIIIWDGEKRRNKNWEQDLIFRDVLHFSCVPCYQKIAKEIGVEKMREYLDLFNYGSINVDSTNLDMFWLEGKSRINQFQQIGFLKTFYQSQLAISNRTEKIMKRMMVIEENSELKTSGKTGWSYSNEKDNGWFVGYMESHEKIYFFATNISPKENSDINLFAESRTKVTYKAFNELKK
jgi:beta-lactamase class D